MLCSEAGAVPAANRDTTMTLDATPEQTLQLRDPRPAPDCAFELGWDYAHRAVVPPAEHLHPLSPVRQGWDAGRDCFGRRTLQADRPEEVADSIRVALEHIAPEQLIVSSDCGFGRQGCNREIAFYKATAIAQGCNIVRRELGLETTHIRAADPALQTDIVPNNATP